MTKLLTIKVLILVLAILAFLFYWFQIRPSMIRSDCYERALIFMEDSFDRNSENPSMSMEQKIEAQNTAYNEAYNRCLNRNGLKQ